jgi:hypothetical protein
MPAELKHQLTAVWMELLDGAARSFAAIALVTILGLFAILLYELADTLLRRRVARRLSSVPSRSVFQRESARRGRYAFKRRGAAARGHARSGRSPKLARWF